MEHLGKGTTIDHGVIDCIACRELLDEQVLQRELLLERFDQVLQSLHLPEQILILKLKSVDRVTALLLDGRAASSEQCSVTRDWKTTRTAIIEVVASSTYERNTLTLVALVSLHHHPSRIVICIAACEAILSIQVTRSIPRDPTIPGAQRRDCTTLGGLLVSGSCIG